MELLVGVVVGLGRSFLGIAASGHAEKEDIQILNIKKVGRHRGPWQPQISAASFALQKSNHQRR